MSPGGRTSADAQCLTADRLNADSSVAGIIVCEGAEADVQEYVQRLKALKWQVSASTSSSVAIPCQLAVRDAVTHPWAARLCLPSMR